MKAIKKKDGKTIICTNLYCIFQVGQCQEMHFPMFETLVKLYAIHIISLETCT